VAAPHSAPADLGGGDRKIPDRLHVVVSTWSHPSFLSDRFHLASRREGIPLACIYVMARWAALRAAGFGHLMQWGWSVETGRGRSPVALRGGRAAGVLSGLTRKLLAGGIAHHRCGGGPPGLAVNFSALSPTCFPARRRIGHRALAGGRGVGRIILLRSLGVIRNAAVARGDIGDYLPIFCHCERGLCDGRSRFCTCSSRDCKPAVIEGVNP